jgi:glycosyltransferase involved in cell wall biosynthesis
MNMPEAFGDFGAVASVEDAPPRILFLATNFAWHGFSEANASEAWLLYSALRRWRPRWHVRFASIEHDATRTAAKTSDRAPAIHQFSPSEAANEIARAMPDALHIVYPWIKFFPAGILENYAAILSLTGADPTEYSSPHDLESIRRRIDSGRLAVICESEGAREVLDRCAIKARAMIPPVVRAPGRVSPPAVRREKLLCGFASSPYLPEHWEPRGVSLLLELASLSPEVDFLLAWRTEPERILREIKSRGLENVWVRAGRLDMEHFYAEVDILLLPFSSVWGNHASPLSGVEGLLRAKPVLATEFVGIAGWLRTEGAGVVTAPTAAALHAGLLEIASRYGAFSKQARVAARRRFNSERNAAEYLPIYCELLETASDHAPDSTSAWRSTGSYKRYLAEET